jgi:hypothetical protein
VTPQDPPVYDLLTADAGVMALLPAGEIKAIFAGGVAPDGTLPPYITWQVIAGQPENYLAERPDMDFFRVQLNFWAESRTPAKALYEAGVAALEEAAHQVSFNADERDPETLFWRRSADFNFWVPR